MFENIVKFFKSLGKNQKETTSKDAAKERLHLVLMQDRANISADFLALMKQEIIEVIKKYIDVDENAIDVRLTNKSNDDGTTGAPVLYANIPIMSVKEEAKEEARKIKKENENIEKTAQAEDNKETIQTEDNVKTENMDEDKSAEEVDTAENNKINEIEEQETNEIIEKAEEIVEEIKEQEEKKETTSE